MKDYCDRMMEQNGSPKDTRGKNCYKMLIQLQRCLILQEAEGHDTIKLLINKQHRVVVRQVGPPGHIFLKK